MENFELIKQVSVLICPKCADQIWSKHRHDMVHCSCGACFIDGGRDYTRWGAAFLIEPQLRVADIILNKETGETKLNFREERR